MRIVSIILLSFWAVDFAIAQPLAEVKTSGNWSNPNTWKSGIIPVNGDAFLSNITRTSIFTTVDYTVEMSSFTVLDAKSGGLTIHSGDTLHITSNFILSNNFSIQIDTLGALIIDGFLISGDTTKSLTDLIINNHGYLSVGQNLYAKNLSLNNYNTVYVGQNMSVGAVDLFNYHSLTISGLTLGSSSGSTFNLYNDATFGEIILGNNTSVTIYAGTKTRVNGSFTGVFNGQNNFTIDGTLIIDGNVNAGNYTITGTGQLYVSGDCDIAADPSLTVKCNDSTLPVSLLEFNGKQSNNYILIHWKSASEINNSHYTVSKSYDGKLFEEIEKIAGAGNSNRENEYSFEELDHHPVIYYQLSQTDFDGKHQVIGVIRIGNAVLNEISVYPNPVKQNQSINISGYTSEMQWTLINTSGQTQKAGNFLNSDRIEVNDLKKGVYLLRIENDKKTLIKRIAVE